MKPTLANRTRRTRNNRIKKIIRNPRSKRTNNFQLASDLLESYDSVGFGKAKIFRKIIFFRKEGVDYIALKKGPKRELIESLMTRPSFLSRLAGEICP